MKHFFRNTSTRIAVIILTIAVIVGILLGCQALFDPHDNRIVEGVTIGGLDVGGMTRSQAREALQEAALETVLVQKLIVNLPEGALELSPSALQMELDIGTAVRTAFRVGRTEDGTVQELGLLPYLTLDREAIRTALQTYADTYDTDLVQPSYAMEGALPDLSTAVPMEEIPCQTLQITLGIPTAHLDVEAAYNQVLEAYDQAIGLCFQETYGITAEVPETALPDAPDLDAIYEAHFLPAVDDGLDLEAIQFVHGSYGYHFEKAAAQQAVQQAGYGETVTIPMECTMPEIFADSVYFRDVLGTCETPHNTNENRNTNLRLLCEALDGMILQPGQDFSYNEAVGERTAERGYKAAPAFSGDRLANAIGGGVCQGSSTLYNCVLLADLEVTNRVCHGGIITYLPLGLDATVNWGTTDFCFRNSANFPIQIQAEVSDGYVKMKILGTDEKDYYIQLQANSWRDGETVIRASSYKLKYDKETDELISRDRIAFSTYYTDIE